LVEFPVAAGFDYIIVDGEHGGVSTETCRGLGQFFRAACTTYLRESRGTREAMA